MARRQSRPSMSLPHSTAKPYRVNQMWEMIQHVYLCWSDFPDLRFGQFLIDVVRDGQRMDLSGEAVRIFNARDPDLEMLCYAYWMKHSGRATKRQQAEWEKRQ